MAQVNLAGRDPEGHPRLYVTHIRSSEIEEWTAKAEQKAGPTSKRESRARTPTIGILRKPASSPEPVSVAISATIAESGVEARTARW
jgi:hypothetical protein